MNIYAFSKFVQNEFQNVLTDKIFLFKHMPLIWRTVPQFFLLLANS